MNGDQYKNEVKRWAVEEKHIQALAIGLEGIQKPRIHYDPDVNELEQARQIIRRNQSIAKELRELLGIITGAQYGLRKKVE